MELSNPRRILLLTPSPPDSCLRGIYKVFLPNSPPPSKLKSTSDPPSAPQAPPNLPSEPQSFPESFHIETAYYVAEIPLWHCPLPDDIPAWKQEWLDMDGADEVVREIGAWIVGFEQPKSKAKEFESIKDMLQAMHEVVRHHMGDVDPYDEVEPPLLIAVALPGKSIKNVVSEIEWEDVCRECGGWEYIDGGVEEKGRSNEYGETMGLPRLLEALEANEWDSAASRVNSDDRFRVSPSNSLPSDPVSSDNEIDLPDTSLVDFLGNGVPGLRRPLLEMKDESGGEVEQAERGKEVGEDDVVELENLMMRMQAVKEHFANLPPTARKAFAARAVRDIMRAA